MIKSKKHILKANSQRLWEKWRHLWGSSKMVLPRADPYKWSYNPLEVAL